MKPLTLRIFGMDCTACAPELKRILLKQNGVLDAEVSYTSGKASLTIDETFFDISQTEHAIKRAGFAIPMEHVVLSCNANVNITEIKEKLSALPGIASVTVSESDHTFLLSLYPIGITR
jgi:copper chaperone CopZ